MAITRADVIKKARGWLNYYGEAILSRDRLYSAFDDVCQQWCLDAKALSKPVEFALVAGQTDYDLAAGTTPIAPDLIQIRNVRFRYATSGPRYDLDYIPYEELPGDWNFYRSTPAKWSSRGVSTLLIVPIPSISVPNNGISVDYYYLPAALVQDASDDAMALPYPAHHASGLMWGMCVRMCEMALEDPALQARYAICQARYLGEVSRVSEIEGDAGMANFSLAGRINRLGKSADANAGMLPGNWGPDRN